MRLRLVRRSHRQDRHLTESSDFPVSRDRWRAAPAWPAMGGLGRRLRGVSRASGQTHFVNGATARLLRRGARHAQDNRTRCCRTRRRGRRGAGLTSFPEWRNWSRGWRRSDSSSASSHERCAADRRSGISTEECSARLRGPGLGLRVGPFNVCLVPSAAIVESRWRVLYRDHPLLDRVPVFSCHIALRDDLGGCGPVRVAT